MYIGFYSSDLRDRKLDFYVFLIFYVEWTSVILSIYGSEEMVTIIRKIGPELPLNLVAIDALCS